MFILGLSCVIKDPREYKIFCRNQMKLLHEGRWIDGMLKEADSLSVMIATGTGELIIPIKQIKKAKLSS